MALAGRKKANVGDLVRSVVLIVPPALLLAYPDPGEPAKGDRDVVLVKSGRSKGRPWHRKPRLQARLAAGYDIPSLRRALGLAQAIEKNDIGLRLDGLEHASAGAGGWSPDMEDRREESRFAADDEEVARLGAMVSVLSFEPLADGVHTRAEAMFVLGFAPSTRPDLGVLRARFRMLAAIHHPDSGYGSHERMSQLNSAMDILRRDS